LISSPWNLKFLEDHGFKTLKGLLPDDYDQLQGIPRVDRVFEILKMAIETIGIKYILEQSQEILEHNHKHIVSYCKEQQERYGKE
jgi:hypothetical protein